MEKGLRWFTGISFQTAKKNQVQSKVIFYQLLMMPLHLFANEIAVTNEHLIVMGWIINFNSATRIILYEESVHICISCFTRLGKSRFACMVRE